MMSTLLRHASPFPLSPEVRYPQEASGVSYVAPAREGLLLLIFICVCVCVCVCVCRERERDRDEAHQSLTVRHGSSMPHYAS
jgi:hypothetical protein